MDIEILRTFLAAASIGSFSGAAKVVNASPSSVTERIKTLEYRLGVKLFDRDKKGCRLTRAGDRFIDLAQQSVRAWDAARQNISLPEEFNQTISFGGQYGLWTPILNDWLSRFSKEHPQLAWRINAASGLRLNRDLSEGFLDVAVMYDPTFSRNISVEKIYNDKLILVTADSKLNYRENYVHIEWGDEVTNLMASKLNFTSTSGFLLNLGAQSAQWLIQENLCGYMPQRIVRDHIASGALNIIRDVPEFDYPAFICWRKHQDETIAEKLYKSLLYLTL